MRRDALFRIVRAVLCGEHDCPRCGSDRVTAGRCLACWWSAGDWKDGHLRPVTDRIKYEKASR